MSQRVCRVRVTQRSRPDAVTRQLSDICTQDRVYARCEILYTFWRLLTCSGKLYVHIVVCRISIACSERTNEHATHTGNKLP